MKNIYGEINNKLDEFSYSSTDNSVISSSEFGISEDEDIVDKNIKEKKVMYIKKKKINHWL